MTSSNTTSVTQNEVDLDQKRTSLPFFIKHALENIKHALESFSFYLLSISKIQVPTVASFSSPVSGLWTRIWTTLIPSTVSLPCLSKRASKQILLMEEILLIGSLARYLQRFIHPKGGWPWDFWTINSIKPCFNQFFFLSPIHGGIKSSCFQAISGPFLAPVSVFFSELQGKNGWISYHPWDDLYIYLHEWLNFMVNVGNLFPWMLRAFLIRAISQN